MNIQTKLQLSEGLLKRIQDTGLSQSEAARKIGDISPATVNGIINRKWETQLNMVSEDMWNKVASWLGVNAEWSVVTTGKNYKRVVKIARDCQMEGTARIIVAPSGHGKSIGLQSYSRSNANVYYVQVGEYWGKKVFLNKLRQAMGIPISNGTVPEIMEEVVDKLNKTTKPLIIIDEAQMILDKITALFVSVYNDVPHCGFIIAGDEFLQKQMNKGVGNNKPGYGTSFSRLGGEYYSLAKPDPSQVRAICEANGVTEDDDIRTIINQCNGDMRLVNRRVKDLKATQNGQ
jgi:hypothetical protein